LRIVGLALVVTADPHIPLCHRTDPGNQPDGPTFAGLTAELVERHRRSAGQVESVALILDTGDCSADNLQAGAEGPYPFISSLAPTDYPESLKVPARRSHSLETQGLAGVRACRTTKEVFGIPRTVVVTDNEAGFVAQSRALLREIAQRQRLSGDLQARLLPHQTGAVRGGERPMMAGARKTIEGYLKARHREELFAIPLSEAEGSPVLMYGFGTAAWRRLQRTLRGKTILVTGQASWSDAEIVRGDRGQQQGEAASRGLESPHPVSPRPQHPWTDQKIRVPVFASVLAWLLCRLLRRGLSGQGMDRGIPALPEDPGQVREVGILTAGRSEGASPQWETTPSRLTEGQCRLEDALDLGR
jgi:hypothetical protein